MFPFDIEPQSYFVGTLLFIISRFLTLR